MPTPPHSWRGVSHELGRRTSHPQQAEVRKALYRELLQKMEVPQAAELVGRIIDVLKRSQL